MTINIYRLLHLVFAFAILITLAVSTSDPPQYSPSPSPSPPPQSGSDDSIPVPSSSQSPSSSPSPFSFSDETVESEIEDAKDSSSGGMSRGKKVGVAFGLLAAACLVGFGGMVYRKRQQNIRRTRYSQSARLEFF
ncbi:hypothetical protein QVD17_32860 [Tagetes erecta]|uniref:Uncharacterized protein n=1 Tax=Tagetes erecta TaxID=13708 RepID=A0AAD8JW56_TARER|nr:hypothetical protein QVD17_32860 [Tagetes erecta]